MPAAPVRISISVVIPVWNDAAALDRALPALLREWPANAIWVVDGGSSDGSADVARRHGVRLLVIGAPSRARQMNAGAAVCGGDVILFLHADTHLPDGARDLIAEAVSRGAIGGAFSRRFDEPSLLLRMTCLMADWRGRMFGAFFGDQAIFAAQEGFLKAGGFPDQPLFEDLEFSRRLSRLGRTVLLRPPVITSGRRFRKRGALRQSISDFLRTVRYVLESPRRAIAMRPGRYPAILLFIKAPVPGRVKTRLARDLGDEAACTICRQMVELQLSALPANWPVEIHYAPASALSELTAWLGSSLDYHPQSEGDLGSRLQRAAAGAFERGHRYVVLIGGDCPTLDAAVLEEAAELLAKDADVVIGPSTDGGYYLLGLRRSADSPLLFEDIPWSSPDVARATMERVNALGLRLEQLEPKEDIDDLAAYRRALAAGHLPSIDGGEKRDPD